MQAMRRMHTAEPVGAHARVTLFWRVQGPLADWAQRLVGAMNSAGEALASEGCASIGEFVLDCLKDCTARGRPASASYLVRELVRPLVVYAHIRPRATRTERVLMRAMPRAERARPVRPAVLV